MGNDNSKDITDAEADTEGHGRRIVRDDEPADKADTEGHVARRFRGDEPADKADDTEGHIARRDR